MATIKTYKTLYLAYGISDDILMLIRKGAKATKEAMEDNENYLNLMQINDGDNLERLIQNIEGYHYAFVSQSDYELLNA